VGTKSHRKCCLVFPLRGGSGQKNGKTRWVFPFAGRGEGMASRKGQGSQYNVQLWGPITSSEPGRSPGVGPCPRPGRGPGPGLGPCRYQGPVQVLAPFPVLVTIPAKAKDYGLPMNTYGIYTYVHIFVYWDSDNRPNGTICL
jgi:hypothetical protein